MDGLAIDGGTAVRTRPLAPWPYFDKDLIQAAIAALESGKVNYWTGEEGHRFEEEYAASVECKHGIAVANGSVALELALRALGIGNGDEVIVTCRTFIASASCIVMCGATPVFADVDRDSQNITAETIEAVLTPRTRAIIAVHLAAWPCDMDGIMKLAEDHDLAVIEDCAQAHGAQYRGRPTGSLGHVAAFSFCQDKIMTTGGEGGMVTTNDDNLWRRMWSFKDHGKDYDAVYHRSHPQGFRWLHESFGTNWRLTEMQSAMGRVMLRRLPEWVERRRANASYLTQRLSQYKAIRLTPPPSEIYHSYYKYYFFVRPEGLSDGWTRDRIMAAVTAEGIPCYSGSCSEVYLEKAFPEALRPASRLPVARELGETSLMVMVHPTMTFEDVADTARALEKVLRLASEA